MMRAFDHIIIGGGIAGTMAAEAIRAKSPQASIAIVGAEQHRLYSRVMMPHVVRGRTPEEKAFLRAPEWYDAQGFTFLPGVTVTRVQGDTRTVELAGGETLEYRMALLIATGGDARKPEFPGAVAANPMYFQTIDDARRVRDTAARSAVVQGGGFIALEMLMNMAHFGIPTVSVVRGNGYFGQVLDARGQEMVAAQVRGAGIDVRFGTEIAAVETVAGGMHRVFFTHGGSAAGRTDCDALGVGLGLVPNIAFLQGSGVATGRGVIVDAELRTTVPGIFAAGDVVECPDAFTGSMRMIGNWQNAMFQGKLAGSNMAGGNDSFTTPTTYSISVFGMPVCFVGATGPDADADERLVREGAQGALQLVMKSGRVVGATCVGPFADRAAILKLITERVVFTDAMRAAVREGRTPLAALLA